MRRGYTKRWRKRWEKGYHKDPLLWLIMDYFIDHANHKDSIIFLPNVGKVEIKRGQHLFSDRQLANLLSVNRQKIRTRIKILKTTHFLTTKSTHKYTIATILNYDIYQPKKDEEKPTEKPTKPSRPNPDLTRPNNVNNYTNKNIADLYGFYLEIINPLQKTRQRALKNIGRWLKKNSYEDLKQAILNYKTNSNGRDRQYRKDPANFFGVNEVFHVDYLPENFIQEEGEEIESKKPTQAGDMSIYDN